MATTIGTLRLPGTSASVADCCICLQQRILQLSCHSCPVTITVSSHCSPLLAVGHPGMISYRERDIHMAEEAVPPDPEDYESPIDGCDVSVEDATLDEDLPAAEGG